MLKNECTKVKIAQFKNCPKCIVQISNSTAQVQTKLEVQTGSQLSNHPKIVKVQVTVTKLFKRFGKMSKAQNLEEGTNMQRKIVMQAIKLIFIISQGRGPFRKYTQKHILIFFEVYWREKRRGKKAGF